MTFNQAKVEPNPPVASVGTGRFPPSVGDTIAGNTERYYSPPHYAPAPANVEQHPSFAPLKSVSFSWLKSFSRFMKGAFAFLLVVALIVTTSMAVYFSQEADHERRRNNELDHRSRVRASRENANSRAQDAWEQMEEALILTQEAAEKAAGAGATLTISDEKPVDLDKYAYPNAEIEAKVNKPGNEALSLITRENFDTVQDFYEKLFGKPVLQVAVDNQRKKILFQSSTQAPILVKVEEFERSQVKITILHSFLRFPRFNEVQAQNLK
ncbi:MAG: hypothetical protein ACREBD_12730 [Blastocatellia bacterium]